MGVPATSPRKDLEAKAASWGAELNSFDFARRMDEEDPLKHLRSRFVIPKNKQLQHTNVRLVDGDAECVYLNGNSLGLAPKKAKQYVVEEMDKWASRGINGHFDDSARPWVDIGEVNVEGFAHIVGAKDSEVVVMNSLTVNLHMMMAQFYKPTDKRHKIVVEEHAFPSDHYAVESQIRHHGLDVATSMRLVKPRAGEEVLRVEDINDIIDKEGDSIALVMLCGVQYYTGQYFPMEQITHRAKAKGCNVGWDLAHAAGNVRLELHKWNCDFAAWCTYKYINGGPGGIGGCFVHETHHGDFQGLAGWWGHDAATRFDMDNKFVPIKGAGAYACSNVPVWQCASLLAGTQVFLETDMEALTTKQRLLTGYLECLLDDTLSKDVLTIITPRDPAQRGCQLSLKIDIGGQSAKPVIDELEQRGLVVDFREPNVIRAAPVPLYNTFSEVLKFVLLMKDALKAFV